MKQQFCFPHSFKCTYLVPASEPPRAGSAKLGGGVRGWRRSRSPGLGVQLCCPLAQPPQAGHCSSLGSVSSARKSQDWPKWSPNPSVSPPPPSRILELWGQSHFAGSCPPESWWGEGGEVSQVSAVFLRDRSFRESLASTFFSLLMKLIMNTARGHLTPEIHVKIKYFRNTYI